MKELSIEEKSRRYDEAIDKFDIILNLSTVKESGTISVDDVRKIFPELSESEDEKIRKALIDYFRWNPDGQLLDEFSNREVLAWFKKQGEQKLNPVLDIEIPFGAKDSEFLGASYHIPEGFHAEIEGNRVFVKRGEQKTTDMDSKFIRMRETKPKDISEFLDRLTTVEKEFLWEHIAKIRELDKQEQKDILEDTILDSNEDGLVAETIRYKNEKKSADKVEPKFHEGEWIIHHGTENVYQVVAVIDTQYQLKYGDNYTIQNCVDVDRCSRLWDIAKDAKDGDVLTCYSDIKGQPIEQTGIIKQYVGRHGGCSNSFKAHFGIDWDNNVVIEGYMGSSNIYPATKEQRDTLERAMTNAGYRWDKEKLKLEKI